MKGRKAKEEQRAEEVAALAKSTAGRTVAVPNDAQATAREARAAARGEDDDEVQLRSISAPSSFKSPNTFSDQLMKQRMRTDTGGR